MKIGKLRRSACDIDYMPLPTWRIFLIQFLNIAGLGPIFGAIAGAVHDYLSGMLSVRHDGLSISEITGNYLGNNIRGQAIAIAIAIEEEESVQQVGYEKLKEQSHKDRQILTIKDIQC